MGQSIQFSDREKDVIKLLLQGKGNKQIALDLGISRRTVEFHLSKVYTKLGVNSRSEAILKLTETDLRESAGGRPGISTVPLMNESNHNFATSIFMKRIHMNKSFLLGLGLLVITAVLCVGSLYSLASQRASEQEAPFGASTGPMEQPTTTDNPVTLPATNTLLVMETVSAPTVAIQPTNAAIPPHTVNGYTAAIESYYVDTSHIHFLVRITGGETKFGDENYYSRFGHADLYDKHGSMINTSGGWGPAVDPELIEFNFVPVTLFTGDRFQGQFAFDLYDAPTYDKTVAQFRFDIDLTIYLETRFYPKQTIAANGLDVLLDSVTVTPTFTQVYLCFTPPSFADWNIGSQSVLQIGGQVAHPHYFRLLFGSDLGGDRRAGSEPYWVPPVKNGRCTKSVFPVGSSNPTSLTLTIPALEQSDPDVLMTDQLPNNYPGLSPMQAYYTYLEEHGNIYKGPWTFTVELTP